MVELSTFIEFLSVVKAKQKELAEEEALLRAKIMEIMELNGLEKESSDYGTVRIQQRNEKQYSERIRAIEEELRQDKKLADDMGDYRIISTKQSLVFNLPKDGD